MLAGCSSACPRCRLQNQQAPMVRHCHQHPWTVPAQRPTALALPPSPAWAQILGCDVGEHCRRQHHPPWKRLWCSSARGELLPLGRRVMPAPSVPVELLLATAKDLTGAGTREKALPSDHWKEQKEHSASATPMLCPPALCSTSPRITCAQG